MVKWMTTGNANLCCISTPPLEHQDLEQGLTHQSETPLSLCSEIRQYFLNKRILIRD